jgi:hypothetical protein
MGFNWGGKKWRPANVPKGQPKINQSIDELLKPLSEKKWKGNVWGSQIMNVEKETTPDVTPSVTPTPSSSSIPPSVTPTPTVTPSITPSLTPTPTPSRIVLTLNQSYQGGIIVYILQSGDTGYDDNVQHGLIMETTDVGGLNTYWGCQGTNITGTTSSIGSGQANTTAIVNQCATVDIAARLCDNKSSGGYSDWYLPSKDEWFQISGAQSLGLIPAANLSDTNRYWTSTQYNANEAWYQSVNDVSTTATKQSNGQRARAVRSF